MPAQKFKKIPVEIDAMLFRTNNENGNGNLNDICIWANQGKQPTDLHLWHNGTNIFVQTLEGTMTANVGDYIIRGVNGEFYPCKPDIFAKTYQEVK